MPTFTVVIPTHNRGYLIARTIQHVLDQSYDDFEVMVVDNGSADNTRAMVTGITDSRVHYVHQEDSGSPASPRNTGISRATGAYVSFLDDDDVWYPNKLQLVLEAFDGDSNFDVVCHYENQRRLGMIQGVNRYGPAEPDMYRRLLFGGNCLSGSATTVRTEALREAGCFREGPEFFEIEDYDLWLRLARMGKGFAFIEDPLGEFVVHSSSGVFAGLHRRFPNLRRMLREHFHTYREASTLDYLRFQMIIARTYVSQLKLRVEKGRRKDIDLSSQLDLEQVERV